MSSAYAWLDALTNVLHAILFLSCNADMLKVNKKKTYVFSATFLCMVLVYLNNMDYLARIPRAFGVTFYFIIYVCFFIKKNYIQAIAFCGLNYIIALFCETITFLIYYLLLGKNVLYFTTNLYLLLGTKIGFICIYYIIQKILCFFWKRIIHRQQIYYINVYIPLIFLQTIFCMMLMWTYFYDFGNAWFGILCFVCTLISLVSDFAIFFYFREIDRKKLAMVKEEYLAIQLVNHQKRVTSLQNDIEKAAKIKQSLKKGLSDAGELLAAQQGDDAKKYLTDITDQFSQKYLYSDNRVVDAIVSEKAKICKEKQIKLRTEMDLPREINIKNAELCVIFANLLDNAIRACENENCLSPEIRLAARERGGYLVIRQENTFDGNMENRKKGYLSEHGLGLGIVEQIAEKYEGSLKTESVDGKFITTVLLKG